MHNPSLRIPAYRLHRASGKAVVTLNGHDRYLGVHNSHASKIEYDRLVHEWLANGRRLPGVAAPATTVDQLLVAYWQQAKEWYCKNGRATSHAHNVQDAMRPLHERYGLTPVDSFGPLALKGIRETFIERGLCRSSINKHIGTLKRIFKWGTENELVPAAVFQALQAVSGLRRGRSQAKESVPVKPVAEAYIDAVLPFVSRQVAAMIQLQLVTGMRPGEVVMIRGCDLDRTGSAWTYTPATHKTEHHDIERPIYLGPKAQEILMPFLRLDPTLYVFDPREAEAERSALRRKLRKTPLTPSQARRRRNRRPEVAPGDRYTTDSYRRAVSRACQLADRKSHQLNPEIDTHQVVVPSWHPHQLRHNAATRLRREFGLDTARVVLGHRTAAITELYAEQDHSRARDVMGRVG